MKNKSTKTHDPAGNVLAPSEVTPDHIRQRAYQIFETRNGGAGNANLDWLQAEQELLATVTDGDDDTAPHS